jgi:hypothetical protein
MPYSTTVEVLNLEGGSFPSATSKIWMLWSVLGTGTGSGQQQSEEGDITVQLTTSQFSISFTRGPDFTYASRQIGLSIQDTNRVADDTGWWFRSGSLETLPNETIEVVLANPVDITQAEVDAALPAMPMTVDANTTITSATAMLAADGFIDLVANGTTTSAGPSVAFTYTLRFKLVPSSSIANAETDVFDIATPDRGSINFAGAGGGVVTAAFLNGVNFFILREVFPRFHARLKSGINSSVISQIAGRIAPGTTTMPPGVVVSARSVNMRVDSTVTPPVARGITVRAALGAYGGVFSKFPSVGTGGGKMCAIMAIGSSTLAAIQPDVFRLFRDNILANSQSGKRLIDLYYRQSDEATRIVLASPGLITRSAVLLVTLQHRLKNKMPLDEGLVEKCRRLLRDIADRGSVELRRDISSSISIVEQNAYFGLFASDSRG